MANDSGATMARLVLMAAAVWISATVAAINQSATGNRLSTLDRITPHSVDIEESGLLTVLYSKSFLDCADLVEGDGRKTHSDPTFFCSPGSMVEETHSLDRFSFTNNEVQLCRDADYDQCSEPTPIRSPAHRLTFYVHCDLAEDLARRLDLRFDCVAPSSELMNEIGRRLSLYAADLQTIFGKRTVRRLAFDSAADVFLSETRPHTGSCCRNPPPRPFGHELWIWAKLTDKPAHGTYGGTMSFDVTGAGVADGLHRDRIHDPTQLQDGSAELQQYWRQIDHITHEFEHVFEAGIGEYYGLAMLDDTTGVEPVVNVDESGDNRYWSRHVDPVRDLPLAALLIAIGGIVSIGLCAIVVVWWW